MREIFLWGLTNYVDAAPMYCASLKAYVHVTHVITNRILQALEFIKLGRDVVSVSVGGNVNSNKQSSSALFSSTGHNINESSNNNKMYT